MKDIVTRSSYDVDDEALEMLLALGDGDARQTLGLRALTSCMVKLLQKP